MGVEYMHCFVVSDVDWQPRKTFEDFENDISKLLKDWKLGVDLVERRYDDKRLCRLESSGSLGAWKKQNQMLAAKDTQDALKKEWRLDFRPSDSTTCTTIDSNSDNEIQWIMVQLGPNFKVVQDLYGQFEVVEEQPFQCNKCGKELEAIDDPWRPGMLIETTICPSICDCGGSVSPAIIQLEAMDETPIPEIAIWKAAFVIDFGKAVPPFANQPISNRKFVKDLENIFASPIAEYGSWY